MTDPTTAQGTPAGWYPDPSGAPQQRWWDGVQWNEATRPNQEASPYGATIPYSYNSTAFAVASGVNPNTRQVWAIALMPLLSIIELIVLVAIGAMSYDSIMSGSTTVVDGADLLVRAVAYFGVVILAVFDMRELARRGVDRPFHWAFAFLGMVYIIGRTVVVKRRTGRGLAPLFVWIGVLIVSFVVPVTIGLVIGIMYATSQG